MPVALGQVSHDIYDAAARILQNKQIETQREIALAQIRSANRRAALGAAENLAGMLNSNNQRAQDRQLQQQRDAQQQRLQQQGQRQSRLQRLLDAIVKENERWVREKDAMRQRGLMHNPDQERDLSEIDKQHDEFVDKINDAISKNDLGAAEAIALQLQNIQQKRWKFAPRTPVPQEFRVEDGQKMQRDAHGIWQPVRNLAAEQAEKIKKDNEAHTDRMATLKANITAKAAEIFQRAYSTGTDFNTAADLEDKHLKANGLPPTGMPRKSAGDPGYYFNDPNKLSQSEKRLEKDIDYLRTRRDKIMDDLRHSKDELGRPRYSQEQLQTEFEKIWNEGGYKALEERVESERAGQRGQTQPSVSQSEGDGISQDYKDARQWMDDFNAKRASGFRFGNPREVLSQAKSVESFIKAYETQNPDKFPQSQASPKAATTAPVAQPQAQATPPQAPQASEDGEPAEKAAAGPFKKGNFLGVVRGTDRSDAPPAPKSESPAARPAPSQAQTAPQAAPMPSQPMADSPSPFSPSVAEEQTAPETSRAAPKPMPAAPAASSNSEKPHVVVYTSDNCVHCDAAKAALNGATNLPFTYEFKHTNETNVRKDGYPSFEWKGENGEVKERTGWTTLKGLKNAVERTTGRQETSSTRGYGGGGLGVLAMMGDPLSGLYERGEPAQAPRDTALATAPDASSTASGDVEDQVGFIEKMKAWLQRNPQPSSSYMGVKGTTNPNQSAYPTYQKGGRVYGGDLPPQGVPEGQYRLQKTLGDVQSRSQSGYQSAGSVIPGFRGSGAGSPQLNPSAFSQALSELDDWEKANPGQDVSAVRKAIGEASSKLPDVFGDGVPFDSKFPSKPYQGMSPSDIESFDKMVESLVRKTAKPSDPVSKIAQQTKALSAIGRSMIENGASRSTAIEATKQIAKANASSGGKLLSGLGTGLRSVGGLGNALAIAGFAASHLQDTRQFLDQQFRDWAVARMAAENNQADQFGIPRSEARRLSNSIDGYTKGLDQGHLSQMRAKADKMVPPREARQQEQPSEYRGQGPTLESRREVPRLVGEGEKYDSNPEVRNSYDPWHDKDGTKRNRVAINDQRFDGDLKRIQFEQTRPLFTTPPGERSLGPQATLDRDAAEEAQRQVELRKLEEQAVKFYGLSGNGEHPKGEDGKPATEAETFTARAKTAQLNGTMQQLDDKGELPPSLLEFPDKFPSWVTRLPAAKWTDKKGVEHHRNDVPTDEEGLQNLVNEISKQKEIGKYSPEAKAAEKAAQEAEQPAAEGDPNADQAPPSASVLSPEMQEHHLRTPKPPTKEAFEKGLRDSGFQPQPGEYEEYLQAREQVRGQLPKSADTTAPGNLFIDKDGKLKQSDGKTGKPVPKDQPLPPGYKNLVPQPNQQPFQGQPQQQGQRPAPRALQPMDIARGAAAAARKQAAEDARSPRQQALDRMDREKQQEIRDFFQPPPIQKRIAPRPLDRRDFQVPQPGVPAGAGIQGGASFTPPTFNDFSSQGQFPSVNLGGSQPNFDNAIASSGFSPQYLPQQQSFQPQYSAPQYETTPLEYYQPPQYEQPYFQPQFDNFSNYQFASPFQPVGYEQPFNYQYSPYIGGNDSFNYGGGDYFYGGGYSDSYGDYSSYV